jgi:hypothetical protein
MAEKELTKEEMQKTKGGAAPTLPPMLPLPPIMNELEASPPETPPLGPTLPPPPKP